MNPVTLSLSKGAPVMACDELRRAFDQLTMTGLGFHKICKAQWELPDPPGRPDGWGWDCQTSHPGLGYARSPDDRDTEEDLRAEREAPSAE